MTDKVRATSESQAKKPARECEQIAGKKMQAGKLAKYASEQACKKMQARGKQDIASETQNTVQVQAKISQARKCRRTCRQY